MAGLAAAMQQQHRRSALAVDVGEEPVAGCADEGCRGGGEVSRHAVAQCLPDDLVGAQQERFGDREANNAVRIAQGAVAVCRRPQALS
jgi:hypothetical protein